MQNMDPNNASDTGMETVQFAERTVKSAITVFKVAESFWEHAMAAMLNPVIWVITLLTLMLLLFGSVIVIIIDGGAVSTETAYVSAAGLGIVDEEYRHGQELFRTAALAKQEEFNAMIRAAYYTSDFPYCDLMYMEMTHPNGIGGRDTSVFNVGYASDEYKAVLENAWNLNVTEPQALALAYVCLQKKMNTAKHTEMDIYDVQFTEEVFAEILDLCAKYSDTVTGNVECPHANCSKKQERTSHYDWDKGEWVGTYHWVPCCEHQHTLHSYGLAFFTKEDVMHALGFTQKEQEWEALTEQYFKTLT